MYYMYINTGIFTCVADTFVVYMFYTCIHGNMFIDVTQLAMHSLSHDIFLDFNFTYCEEDTNTCLITN